jgi:hypothetical protein
MSAARDTAIDKFAVIELCRMPHWAYDHESWDDLDDVFTETLSMPTVAQAGEPSFDLDSYLGRYLVSRTDMKRGMAMFRAGLVTQHLIAGHHVTLVGDTAVCRAHSINIHMLAEAHADQPALVHGNEYRFDCIRTGDDWRIRGWVSTVRWSFGDDSFHDVAAKQRAWLESNS